MTKSLMISIQPQHAVNILNGKKTLELRTWIPKDYVGWVYVYVTKGKPYLGKNHDGDIGLYNIPAFGHFNKSRDLNGKVAFRFWFDEYETIKSSYYPSMQPVYEMTAETLYLLKLSKSQVNEYGKGKDLYAWHIKQLEIFDTPKELSDFYTASHFKLNKFTTENIDGFDEWLRIKKAPQRSVWVYTREMEE